MNIIKRIRLELGDTQKEFAEKLYASVDSIKSWESSRRQPSPETIEMLITINNNIELEYELKRLHPIHDMALEIINHINEQKELHGENVEVRFALHGESGSGKTRAISIVNEYLTKESPYGELAECNDLIWIENYCKALDIINDQDLAYEDSSHIAFSIMNKELANSLESNNIKVFYF